MPDKGFFGSLFDIDFTNFVTTKIIKFLFVVAIVLAGLYTLFLIAAGFGADSGIGVVLLLLSPLLFLLMVIYTRVLLELVMVVFRIYENTSVMAGTGGAVAAPEPQAPQQPPQQPPVPPFNPGGPLPPPGGSPP